MKKLLVFLGLKAAEVSAIVFIPWGLGLLIKYLSPVVVANALPPMWILGIMSLFVIYGIVISIYFIYIVVLANWDWADKIINKKSEI